MFGSVVIDVIIGLTFVYFLLSTIVSTVAELISAALERRSKTLRLGIQALLMNDDKLVERLYDQPLITGLCPPGLFGRKSDPSYISSSFFSLSLLEALAPNAKLGPESSCGKLLDEFPRKQVESEAELEKEVDAAEPEEREQVRRELLAKRHEQQLRNALHSIIKSSGPHVEQARAGIEKWYDEAMQRLTGRYKRRTQSLVLLIAVFLVVSINADTITLVRSLTTDPSLRELVVNQAVDYTKENSGDTSGTTEASGTALAVKGMASKPTSPSTEPTQTPEEILRGLQLPFGWSDGWPKEPDEQFLKFVGLLLTTAAVSLGAPFWFDVLSRFVNLRSSLRTDGDEGDSEKKKGVEKTTE